MESGDQMAMTPDDFINRAAGRLIEHAIRSGKIKLPPMMPMDERVFEYLSGKRP